MPYLKGKQSVLIRKHFEDRESWLEGRQELGIGGSDAAAVCGLSPWTSPVELWKIKTGQKKAKDISANAAVERGVRMEPALRELYAAMNPQMEVKHYPYDILSQLERPWLTATLDGELTDENGRQGILEIKTGQLMKKADYDKWADGNVPVYYLTQTCCSRRFRIYAETGRSGQGVSNAPTMRRTLRGCWIRQKRFGTMCRSGRCRR